MKHRQGSALVLVMCIAAALSVLMLRIYARASLLLQTVVQRERDIKLNYAAQALAVYAIHMAKHNWSYLLKNTAQGQPSEHRFSWDIDDANKAPAICSFKATSSDRLVVEVYLEPERGRAVKISCELSKGKGDKVVINGWKVE